MSCNDGKLGWTQGTNAKAMTKDSNTRKRMGAERNANKGMAMKQPSNLTEMSIQTVTVCVIQSGLMGSMGSIAEFRATLE
jgi:hypothetical protein